MKLSNPVVSITTGALRLHVNFVPPVDRQVEKQVSEMFRKAAQIVRRKTTPNSKTAALFERLKQGLSYLETDEVREKLRRKISKALKAGGIPHGVLKAMTEMFVYLSVNHIDLLYAKAGDGVILYLKCGSIGTLVKLREMVLSRVLLRLLSEAIRKVTESQARLQLVVKAEDYSLTLSYLNSVAGRFVSVRYICANGHLIINKQQNQF